MLGAFGALVLAYRGCVNDAGAEPSAHLTGNGRYEFAPHQAHVAALARALGRRGGMPYSRRTHQNSIGSRSVAVRLSGHGGEAAGQNSGQNSCKTLEILENMEIESSNVTRDLRSTNHVRDVEVASSNLVAPTLQVLAGLQLMTSNSRALLQYSGHIAH